MINTLRNRIKELEAELRFAGRPYPIGIEPFPKVLTGQGFFPGGDGLWRENTYSTLRHASPYDFPKNGIMFLGNDFGSLNNFKKLKLHENPPTWWRLRKRMDLAEVPGRFGFFTNAYLGLKSDRSALEKGIRHTHYDELCSEFLKFQITIQEPRLIIVLGDRPSSLLQQVLPSANLSSGDICQSKLEGSLIHILQVTHPYSDLGKSPVEIQSEANLMKRAWATASS